MDLFAATFVFSYDTNGLDFPFAEWEFQLPPNLHLHQWLLTMLPLITVHFLLPTTPTAHLYITPPAEKLLSGHPFQYTAWLYKPIIGIPYLPAKWNLTLKVFIYLFVDSGWLLWWSNLKILLLVIKHQSFRGSNKIIYCPLLYVDILIIARDSLCKTNKV